MDKTYQPEAIEQALYQSWQKADVFKRKGTGKSFCIMLPPPNVTGSLHMGHAFQHTLMDILIRYHHMKGDDTHWQVGTDHAGIATQMVVENQLKKENKTRHDLGREGFIKRVWEWKEESGNTITGQMRRLGLAVNWECERFTMDEDLSKAVKAAFIKLYDEKLIYRAKRLVNWDPVFKTAVSDLEVIPTEEQGSMWHIRYFLTDGSDSIVVATTRPETMLGDVAVAVHPEDERYKNLIGKMLRLPLTNREIPIISNEYVDPAFGTGCVKITPAHDFNDYEMGKRHQLELINIFDDEAKINSNAPEAYQGLDRFVARKQIIKDLTEQELLVKIEPHALKIPRNDRGGAVIEPYLMDQWYVNMKAMSAEALKAAAKKDLTFIPENWINTYNEWLENIQDWCISRQLWWGHRIPVWYDENKNTYVGEDEADVRRKNKLDASIQLTQDEDVLDTWFSSALWPFSTLGWPDVSSEMLKTFYPTSVLVTGFDIIFFWVARMVMFGLKFMHKVPFEKVYITGLIRDQDGQKMSKTKGNVLDPIDLIDGISLPDLIKKRTSGMMQERLVEKVIKATEKQFPEGIAPHGTDAVRFTFAALASHSRDINFDVKRLEGYRNFCNKLWNAARFVMMNVEGKVIEKQKVNHPINKWILQHLQDVIKDNEENHLKDYRFDLLAHKLYELVWHFYCDWYLEFSKTLIQDQDAQSETCYVLVYVLEMMLRALHPIIPFVTETIWNEIKPLLNLGEEFILNRDYPSHKEMSNCFPDQGVLSGDPEALLKESFNMSHLQQSITKIRTFRSENRISPSKVIKVLFTMGNWNWGLDEQYVKIINQLARVDLQMVDSGIDLPEGIRLDVMGMTYHIPFSDFIDVEAELKRVHKELANIDANMASIETKLGNPSFVDKAPPAVIEKERERLNEQKTLKEKLLIKVSELQKLA